MVRQAAFTIAGISLLVLPVAIAKVDTMPEPWRKVAAWAVLISLLVILLAGIPSIVRAIRDRQ